MATVKQLLRQKPNSKGLYPIILKLYKGNKTKIITLGINIKKNQWDTDRKQVRKSVSNYKELNKSITEQVQRIEELINSFEAQNIIYSLSEIEQTYRNGLQKSKIGQQQPMKVLEFAEKKENDLKNMNKFPSAAIVRDTRNSLKRFLKSDCTFGELNANILRDYENHLRSRGAVNNGISLKQREIRTWWNCAKNNGWVNPEKYPYKEYKISALKPDNIPISLTTEEVKKIEKLQLESAPELKYARDLFLLILYSGGVNLKDLAYLTTENIKENRVYFKRKKTNASLNFLINNRVQEILNSLQPLVDKETNYLVPIFNRNSITEEQKNNRYNKVLKAVNKSLKIIGSKINTKKTITTYVARHTFAIFARDKGAGMELVGQILGHTNLNTTKGYFGKFPNEKTDEVLENLIYLDS